MSELTAEALRRVKIEEFHGIEPRFKKRHKRNRFLTCLECCMLRNPNYFK